MLTVKYNKFGIHVLIIPSPQISSASGCINFLLVTLQFSGKHLSQFVYLS